MDVKFLHNMDDDLVVLKQSLSTSASLMPFQGLLLSFTKVGYKHKIQ